MTLKEKFLNIKYLNELSNDEIVELINVYFIENKDKEVFKHYNKITKGYDYKKSKEILDRKLEHGFEIPWLLRKEKFN